MCDRCSCYHALVGGGSTRKALVITFVVLVVLGIGGLIILQASKGRLRPRPSVLSVEYSATQAGKRLSDGQCEDTGVPHKLSISPMKPEDFSIIVPYGLMVGGHVTPIDHQYYSPTVFRSPRDTYGVRAMADSTLVRIQPRVKPAGTEYRMHFAVTCTFLYYYDLVTSLAPDIQQAYDEAVRSKRPLRISVRAGQLVGRIGGQTLDFAVWDTTKKLSGFLVPEHYDAEPWKVYTADPLAYVTVGLRSLMLSKYVRTAEPRSGKIDHDIDGRVVGNWFEKGTGGYEGTRGTSTPAYWTGHLAIAPDLYDPTAFLISVGSLAPPGDGPSRNQFSLRRAAPNPNTVGVAAGLVRYELADWRYIKAGGNEWDRLSSATGVRLENDRSPPRGCALVQLMSQRTLKFELFLSTPCSAIAGFDAAARVYER